MLRCRFSPRKKQKTSLDIGRHLCLLAHRGKVNLCMQESELVHNYLNSIVADLDQLPCSAEVTMPHVMLVSYYHKVSSKYWLSALVKVTTRLRHH